MAQLGHRKMDAEAPPSGSSGSPVTVDRKLPSRDSTGSKPKSSPRVAVIGGGAFGVTSAVKLGQSGCNVDLFEKADDILTAASGINQYRLHRGYHYPRSPETASSCLVSEPSFRGEYGEAVVEDFDHYYCIATRGSRTSADQFTAFCEAQGLELERSCPGPVRAEAVDLCVRVNECLFDPAILRSICWDRLRRAQVNVFLRTDANKRDLSSYDYVVVCTYSAINQSLRDFPDARREYQFELCEKPVVRLPESFHGKSIVVLDGPFMCVDPLGSNGLFVLGNVVHAIHQTNVGRSPIISRRYRQWLNKGIVEDPPVTNFNQFISSASGFFNDIGRAEHVGSMFTIRTVFPDRDGTDERPTLVEQLGDRTIVVFSGKIGTCVQAAHQVVRLVTG